MKVSDFMSHFPGYLIQTLDDKSAREAEPFREPLRELVKCGSPFNFRMKQLKEMNEKGAGIFFTPNKFPMGARRLADNCQGINAWFMECDWCSKEQQMKMIEMSPLEPSFIVETGKSYHCYWLAQDGKIQNFKEIQKRLIEAFNADKANIDASRVFRVPGFNHMKKEPFPVKIVKANPRQIYTEEVMRKAFPLKDVVIDTPKLKIITSKPSGGKMGLWDVMAGTNNREMLKMLSGDLLVSGEQFTFRPRTGGGEHIDVDGKPADAWLDERGLIGSGKGGGPTWIQWVEYYGKEKRDIAEWFKLKFPNSFDEGDEVEPLDVISDKILSMVTKERISWGVDILDKEATVIDRGSYVMLVGETASGKTPFALQMALENSRRGLNVAFFSLEMPNDSLLYRWARNRLGITIDDVRTKKIPMDLVKMEVAKFKSPLMNFMKFSVNKVSDLKKQALDIKADVIVLDNIGFVQADMDASDNAKDKAVSRALLELSRDYGITVIAIQHFRKRAGEKKGGGADDLFRSIDSISGSGKFSHDITHLVQVARIMENATVEDQDKFFVLVQKDRPYDHRGAYELRYRKGVFI